MAKSPEVERITFLGGFHNHIYGPVGTVRIEAGTTTFSHESSAVPFNSHHSTAQLLDIFKKLPEPTRALKWIFAFFEERPGNRISQKQLYRHYESVFGRSGGHISALNFFGALVAAFPKAGFPAPKIDECFTVEGIALRTPTSPQHNGDLTELDRWLNKRVEAVLVNLLEDLQTRKLSTIDPSFHGLTARPEAVAGPPSEPQSQAVAQAQVQAYVQADAESEVETEAGDSTRLDRLDLTPDGCLSACSDTRGDAQGTSQKRRRTPSATGDDIDEVGIQKSTRKARKPKVGRYDDSGPKPRLVFSYSTIINKKNIIRRFEELGGTVVDRIQEANILCVGKGVLKKTSKFLLAIVLGKTIVTEQWLISSAHRDRLLDPKKFLPQATTQEKAWKFSLQKAVNHGPQSRNLLIGRTIVLTSALKNSLGPETFREYKMVLSALGARTFYMFEPSVYKKGHPAELYIGTDNDVDAPAVARLKMPFWNKDMIPLSILRGELQTNSEFQIGCPVKAERE